MKLSQHASSSDLDVARAIAQRLHQRRRGTDVAPLSALDSATAGFGGAPVEVPAPVWSVETPEPVAAPEPVDPLAGLADSPPPSGPAPVGMSPEELVPGAHEPLQQHSVDAMVAPEPGLPEASAFDEVLDAAQEGVAGPGDASAPPSWDDIAEICLGLSQARGAMLVDPAGQVVVARGEWPEPGPDAIAGKLVAMMERTLKDAPTRSVSAPLAGLHLTAWRVPLPEGLVTAAFIAKAPVRADTRPAIDAEIHRGAGA